LLGLLSWVTPNPESSFITSYGACLPILHPSEFVYTEVNEMAEEGNTSEKKGYGKSRNRKAVEKLNLKIHNLKSLCQTIYY
jgi:hypothetical protein